MQNFIGKWLTISKDQRYHKFQSYIILEKEGMREQIHDIFAQIIFAYHHDVTSYLKDLEFQCSAKSIEQRPPNFNSRKGNFGEILGVEILRYIRDVTPFPRFRYFQNPRASSPGYDIIAYQFAENREDKKDLLFIGESKARLCYSTKMVMECHEKLRGIHPRPGTLSQMRARLRSEGKDTIAEKLTRFDRLNAQPLKKYAIFITTHKNPKDPYGIIESLDVPKIRTNLETFHLRLSDLNTFITTLFEKDVDPNDCREI